MLREEIANGLVLLCVLRDSQTDQSKESSTNTLQSHRYRGRVGISKLYAVIVATEVAADV